MAKALITVAILVALAAEYCVCKEEGEFGWLETKRSGTTVEDPMETPHHSFGPDASSTIMENREKGEKKRKQTLETQKKETFSPVIQDDKILKSAEAPPKKSRAMLRKASYDLKFKTDTRSSELTGFPTLNKFTLCFWMKFDKTPIEELFNNRYILKYFNNGKRDEVFAVGAGCTRRKLLPTIFINLNQEGDFYWIAKNDTRWHHYCFAVGGYSLPPRGRDRVTRYVTHLLIDGKEQPRGWIHSRAVAKAGGKMVFGGFGASNFPGSISGLNIWDKITAYDIAPSCDGSNPGNVKSWSGIKTELNLKKFTVVSPSTCKKVDDDK